jgi:glycosyltransferase involved in cell wall biosynthesis
MVSRNTRLAGVPIAFVRDWLTVYGGADRTMEAALELFPEAPIYALLYQRENFLSRIIARHPVHTSFLDRLPGGRTWHRAYLPLMPLAIEQFNLRAYDVVVSLSHVVAKGVLTRADQLHISYLFTPVRYAWDLYFQYLDEVGWRRGPRSWAVRVALHYLRMWDTASSTRPDILVADSRAVARRIWKLYRRRAEVIYPPVDIDRFQPRAARDDFYLTVSRLVPYKKVPLITEAFTKLKRPLVVIGDGPDRSRVERVAGSNVELLGSQPDHVVADYMARCKAFIFAAEEDFGIAPVEAQAAGAPVIAYGRGGATESVIPGETGLFFGEQSVESLGAAVRQFERQASRFVPDEIRLTTRRFSRERFQRAFATLVEREWETFEGHGPFSRMRSDDPPVKLERMGTFGRRHNIPATTPR